MTWEKCKIFLESLPEGSCVPQKLFWTKFMNYIFSSECNIQETLILAKPIYIFKFVEQFVGPYHNFSLVSWILMIIDKIVHDPSVCHNLGQQMPYLWIQGHLHELSKYTFTALFDSDILQICRHFKLCFSVLSKGCSSVIEYSWNLIWPRSFFILSIRCWFS